MTADAVAAARSVHALIQDAVDARDEAALQTLFAEGVLVGTAGDGRRDEARQAYLRAVATQPVALRWEYDDVVPFHDDGTLLGFAAFGEIVVADDSGERRAPFRVTILAARAQDGWRLRQFHGSIPSDFS